MPLHRRPTLTGMQSLLSEYGKTWLGVGGIFGGAAILHPTAAVCASSFLVSAHVADMAVNDDLDEVKLLPRSIWNRLCGPIPERKRVVVCGSGWGALSFARKLDPMLFDVTVLSPRSYFFYTPLLAGVTTGSVKAHSILEAVRQTTPMPHATYLNAWCTGIDKDAKLLHCANQETDLKISYDHLVIAVGTQPNTFGIPGVEENAMFLKELDHGLSVRKRILERLEQAMLAHAAGCQEEVSRLLSIAVVGGGPTGVEFAAEVIDFVNSDVKHSFPTVADKLQVTLVEALPQILPMFDGEIGQKVNEHLNHVGVDVRTDTMVKNVDGKTITLARKSGEVGTLDYGVLVWVAGQGARPISKKLAAAFGQSNPRGLEVDEYLRVKGASGNDVFALGDCAVSGCALTAQAATQQGKYLGRVFRDEGATASSPFVYHHQGTMAYVGKHEAVAVLQLGASHLKAFSFWRKLASCPDSWLKPQHRLGDDKELADGSDKKNVNVLGVSGYGVWRAVYFSKLFSYSNRFNVASDWVRSFFFGRVVASSLQSSGQ